MPERPRDPLADVALIPQAFAAMGTEGRILRATMECIVRHGIAATTTHAIARRAGVNQGIIHYHFRDKNELLMRLLHLMFAEGLTMMDAISASDLPARRKVERVLELGHRFITKRGDVFAVYIAFWAHALAQGGQWQGSYQKLRERVVTAIRDIIRAGERSGEFRKGVSAPAAELLLACVHGLGLQSVMGPTVLGPRRVGAYFGMFMQFLLGAAELDPGARKREQRNLTGSRLAAVETPRPRQSPRIQPRSPAETSWAKAGSR